MAVEEGDAAAILMLLLHHRKERSKVFLPPSRCGNFFPIKSAFSFFLFPPCLSIFPAVAVAQYRAASHEEGVEGEMAQEEAEDEMQSSSVLLFLPPEQLLQ